MCRESIISGQTGIHLEAKRGSPRRFFYRRIFNTVSVYRTILLEPGSLQSDDHRFGLQSSIPSGHAFPKGRNVPLTKPFATLASDTSIPGNASDYAVYRDTQRPRRDAMSQGGFVPASPCEERLTRQGYPRPRSD